MLVILMCSRKPNGMCANWMTCRPGPTRGYRSCGEKRISHGATVQEDSHVHVQSGVSLTFPQPGSGGAGDQILKSLVGGTWHRII